MNLETLKYLILDFLSDHSHELSQNGCNDWEWPDWMSTEDRKDLMAQYIERGDFSESDKTEMLASCETDTYGPPDFVVVDILVDLLGGSCITKAPSS